MMFGDGWLNYSQITFLLLIEFAAHCAYGKYHTIQTGWKIVHRIALTIIFFYPQHVFFFLHFQIFKSSVKF